MDLGMEGWDLGMGCALPSWGSGGGLAPRKKKQFWYFFPILQHKNFQRIRESGGDYPPSPKSGDLSPCPPLSDAYAPIDLLQC